MNPITNWKTTLACAVFAALIALNQFTSAGGDVNDWTQWIVPVLIALVGALLPDPKSGGGGKPPGVALLLCLLLPMMLIGCATDASTDRELTWAKAGVEAAQLTLDVATISYQSRLADPRTTAAEKLLAQTIFKEARQRLETEKARLAEIQARRKAGTLTPAATVLLPPLVVTEAK